MEKEFKSVLLSKTHWAQFLTVVAAALAVFNIDFTTDKQQEIAGLLSMGAIFLFQVIGFIGRRNAVKPTRVIIKKGQKDA